MNLQWRKMKMEGYSYQKDLYQPLISVKKGKLHNGGKQIMQEAYINFDEKSDIYKQSWMVKAIMSHLAKIN